MLHRASPTSTSSEEVLLNTQKLLQSLFSEEDTTKMNPESIEGSKVALELGETSDSQSGSQYKVLKEISRGTMSTVYYCEGGIALKSMGEEVNPDAVAIYKNDLNVLSALGQHPYIVRLYDTTETATITHVTTGLSETVSNC